MCFFLLATSIFPHKIMYNYIFLHSLKMHIFVAEFTVFFVASPYVIISSNPYIKAFRNHLEITQFFRPKFQVLMPDTLQDIILGFEDGAQPSSSGSCGPSFIKIGDCNLRSHHLNFSRCYEMTLARSSIAFLEKYFFRNRITNRKYN